ncbi:MAG: tetratricopeptide repeat protein [Sandaracinaceae bacterium]
MWFGDVEAAERREAQGHAALEAGDLEAAEAAAAALIGMRWSGGFVIRALALRAAGRPEAATSVLEDAVTRVPADGRLWQLLGNLRSDLGRLDDALVAFGRALEGEGVSTTAVRFNRAVAHRRAERFGEALADLEPILGLPSPPGEIAASALSLALDCLAHLGRAEDACAMVEAALDRCAEDDPRRPALHAEHALALHRGGAPRAAVEAAFTAAVDGGAATPALFLLARALFPSAASDAPRRYRLVVRGPAPAGLEAEGFLRVFDVVAASPEAALEMARRFVGTEARTALAIEQHAVIEEAPALEPGVHGASEPMLFA